VGLPERGPWPHPYFETPDETLAVDLVGSGTSEKPLDLVYSVDKLARFVAAYVRALDVGSPYLVGNSLGGLVCLKVLLDSPDLARRYVHIHAPGYPMFRAKMAHLLLGLPPVRWVLGWFVHRFRERFVAWNVHYERDDMLSREEVSEYARQFETTQGAKVFVRILRESVDPAEHASIIATLRRTAETLPPVLLLYARRDPLVPPEFGDRYADDIFGAPLHWIADSSHFVQVEQPARTVTEIRDFDQGGAAS
jgi:pimeloyl-ACP methyl ester carboxylesterase